MFSWLHQWDHSTKKILPPPSSPPSPSPSPQQPQSPTVSQRFQYSHNGQHLHSSSISLPLSEKVMISPKSIAIAKKTAVHASGDDTSSLYHQPFGSNSHREESTITANSSAASMALSAELIKEQHQQQQRQSTPLGHGDPSTIASPPIPPKVTEQPSANVSVASLKSVSSSSSSSPPRLPFPIPSPTPSPQQQQPHHYLHHHPKLLHQQLQRSSSTSSRTSSSTTPACASPSSSSTTSRPPPPPVMHPSPKRSATRFSTSVSANGDIVFETHSPSMTSNIDAPLSSSPSSIDHQPTPSATEEGSRTSMISVSLAEKHLLDMIQPLPPPMTSSSSTATTTHSTDVIEGPDDLQQQPLLQQEHELQQQQRQQQPRIQSLEPSSLDRVTVSDIGGTTTTTTTHEYQPIGTDQPILSTQQMDQVGEKAAPPKGGFWSWLILSSPPSAPTNQKPPSSTPANGASDPTNQHEIDGHSNPETKVPVKSSISTTSSSVQPVTNSTIKGVTKNHVLPLFRSQYRVPPSSSSSSTVQQPLSKTPSGNLFDKAMESIQSLIQQASINMTKSNDRVIVTDPDSWRQQMKARFARFIDEMKSDPHSLAGKKVVVIGVHGWFPMKLVRSVVGEPTGTSTKFCEQMVAAVKKYFELEHGLIISENTTTITSIPLEGEGKVEDRVNKLYTNLIHRSDWLEAVSMADVILWATHSQGTPVSAMLMHRLLERGHIHTHRQSVGMLAMAGISHGPFPVLKGSLIVKYFEADAARELFEFMDSESDISKKFRASLAYIMQRGIKLTLVGSMQDQVVPLYSAIISAISHPNIVRSVYIDGHIFTPENDFIIHLITFALGLRNAGLSDHGLMTHLSEVLAGSLYALEGGHSTIYEELDVYYLAVQHLFETDPLGKAVLINHGCDDNVENGSPTSVFGSNHSTGEATLRPFQAKSINKNPYYLPWAMRGLCEDQAILKNDIWAQQLDQLRHLFEAWEPTSPKLRSVKFRLEPFTFPLL